MIVGYTPYLELVKDLTAGKELLSSGMMQEHARVELALERAAAGACVALISSGDAGIYGMAGLALELIAARQLKLAVEVVPGVSAAQAAAARMGAPLMLDFATISLSDLLVPWETIQARLEAVAAADLVVALYNPRSKKRVHQLEDAAAIFSRHRPATTPVGIGTCVGSEEETITLSDLDHFLSLEIGMRSVVIVGNRSSRVLDGRWFVTPRGYDLQTPAAGPRRRKAPAK